MNLEYSTPGPSIFRHIPTGMSSHMFSVDANPIEESRPSEPLEIIGQPCLTSKLRHRSDFDTNKNRRAVLRSGNNQNYRSPAIRVNSFSPFF